MSWMRPGLAMLALILIGATGCGGPGTPGVPEPPEGSPIILYKIVPGDVLAIDGGKHEELSKEQAHVDEKGEINLLYIGKIEAAGLTTGELEEAINAEYAESGNYEDPQVSVTVLTLYYYVDGQVRLPGRKLYMREVTLYRAIVDAGSFSEYAAPAHVRLLRPGPDGTMNVYKINVKKIMQGAPDSVVILPNDVIRVPKSIF